MLVAMYLEPPAAKGFVQPTLDEVREALSRCRPELSSAAVRFLGEGWASWAYEAGGVVLRFPKLPEATQQFEVARRLAPVLAPRLPVKIPEPLFECAGGPNGLPFVGATFVPGATPQELQRPASPRFAADAGRLLRALHSFPVEEAVRLGLPFEDGPAVRDSQTARYEAVIRRVFPLISCEARSYAEVGFEVYLNEPSNFAFEPVLVHYDFDQRNTHVDPVTGDLCGLVDFGGARVSDPAGDFVWLLTIGLRDLGIADQRDAMLQAYSQSMRYEDLKARVDYYFLWWPFEDILHGLNIEDEDFVAEGIRALNARVPFGTKCE